jgi:multiple sugar transport system ATP-binding protein
VAFFIGTPSINLFNATLRRDGSGIEAVNSAFTLALSPYKSQRLASYVGKQIILGIRPEDFSTPKAATFAVTEGNSLRGVVNVIEPAATGCSVYLSTAEGEPQEFAATFKIRLPASYLAKEIPLAINPDRIHVFDPDTEDSLLYEVPDTEKTGL